MLRTIFLIIAALTTGNAFAHEGPANTEERELIRKAKVLVIIGQDKAEAAYIESNAGKSYGMIGMSIDLLDNNARIKKQNEALLPLQAATADLDFRHDLVAQLRGLKIFDPTRIELIEKAPETKSELLKLVASAGDPVVIVEAHYLLTPTTYRALAVELGLSLWTGNQKKAIHKHGVTHISEPVTHLQTYPEPVTLTLWTADGGRRYRAAYAQGIAGSIDLLVKVLELAPPAGAKWEGRVNYTDGAMKPNQYGYVVEESIDRVALLDGQTLTSIPIVPNFAARQQDIRPVKPTATRVYFYRPGQADTYFFDPSVYANGSKLGDLRLRTYTSIDLPPGNYSFRVKYEGNSPGASIARGQIDKVIPVEIDAKAGNEYFVRYDGYKGVWTKEDILKQIEPDVAFTELKPLLPNWW